MSNNKKIINNFQLLIEIENAKDKTNHFRIRSYQKVLKILQGAKQNLLKLNEDELTKFFQANGIKNPVKTIDKINQIKTDGKVKGLDGDMEKVKAIKEFTSIYAVGIQKAKELFNTHQLKTIKQLKKKLKEDNTILNDKQKIGLKYHKDLLTRIPRDEIVTFDQFIAKILKPYGKDIEFSIAGSYRRGAKNSGDIDLLITSSDKLKKNEAMNLIIDEMKKHKILYEVLAKGRKKFMGIVKIDGGPARHLDIVETTRENYPFALLYFTGSGPFNVRMRKIALDKGYSINEYSMTYKKTKKIIESDEIQKKIGKPNFITEQDIFKFLDMEYKLPTER